MADGIPMKRPATFAIYALVVLIGVATFVAPFLLPRPTALPENAAPLLSMLLLALSLVALLVEVQGQAVSAKIVAALGILVAVTSVLRFIEVALPGPGGFSPIFAPIILAGYIFGSRFGFLLGVMTLLVSALLTGGVGPWLPYQMFTAGWIGLASGWLPRLSDPRAEIGLLAIWGFLWGVLYGLIINVYLWPLAIGSLAGWQPAGTLAETVGRYLAFYAATSLLWDVGRAVGNVGLILILGAPALRALTRFRDRFHYELAGVS
jgi:energy-coupling factor transport system substrate-specific component